MIRNLRNLVDLEAVPFMGKHLEKFAKWVRGFYHEILVVVGKICSFLDV
ncbi:MAG: hypothetical protein KAR55_06165 [Thermoplasmatales archaeon]|nr:hypothetical protein [Thermoplasmatales archaeon]